MKILFISGGGISDAVISTGILSALMDEYPEATFTVAVGPAAMPLFDACPQIERVISMFRLPWNKHWFLLWKQCKDTMWDLIVDLSGSVMSYILNTHHRRIFQKADKSLPKADQLAKLMEYTPTPPPRLWIGDEARVKASNLLPKDKTLIVFAPKTNSAARDWPIARFVELAHKLYQENTLFVIMGTSLQHQSIQPLFRTLPQSYLLDLTGKTDLPMAYAVIEKAKLFIGSDSGLLHLAAVAKTPSIGIFGPTNDKTYAPKSDNLRIVTAVEFVPGDPEKLDKKYMDLIPVEKVEAAAHELGGI